MFRESCQGRLLERGSGRARVAVLNAGLLPCDAAIASATRACNGRKNRRTGMDQARRVKSAIFAALLTAAAPALAAPPPWMNIALDPDKRAALLEAQMTTEEKLTIVHGPMGRA